MTYELKLWTRPDHYAGATWPDHYVFLSRTRDSDDLTESNFAIGLEQLGGETATVRIVRESHWAVGWIEWIAIHKSDSVAIEKAQAMINDLNDYPILDDDDHSQREIESANQVWKGCYDVSERIEYIREHRDQFEFHDLPDMINCIRGNYFAGYASELLL